MLKFRLEVHHRYSRQRKVGNPHFSYYIGPSGRQHSGELIPLASQSAVSKQYVEMQFA